MKFKLSKSLGFGQKWRQERKVGSSLKDRMHHMNFQENQMGFPFPVNRNILFINPILKWILQGYKCFSLYIEGAQAKPQYSSPSTKEDWLNSKTRLASWLCLNGQLYMQHHWALGWLKQTHFSVSARSLPCRALNLRLLLIHIPNFQLISHLHRKICQSSVSILHWKLLPESKFKRKKKKVLLQLS